MFSFRTLGLSLGLALLSACQTTASNGRPEKPQITRDMELSEAYALGRVYGADILQKTKELAKERNQIPLLHKYAEQDLMQHGTLDDGQLSNVANMYVFSSTKFSPEILQKLLRSKQVMARRVGWRLAALKPSTETYRVIELYLDAALSQGKEDEVLMPEMATALQENKMSSEYTFLVRGLMLQGNPEYANAMLALDARKAAPSFLNYLMLADLDDLRQMNQKSVNIYTSTVIFRFLMDNPIPLNHPGLTSLFLFAVSRNRALAEMANAVLEKHIPEDRQTFAAILARTPVNVQIAFIENTQRDMTPNMRLLLSELKDVAQQKEVLEELNAPQPAGAQ